MHLLCGTPLPLWELRTHACAYAAVAPLRVNGWIRRENPSFCVDCRPGLVFRFRSFHFLKEINFRE